MVFTSHRFLAICIVSVGDERVQ